MPEQKTHAKAAAARLQTITDEILYEVERLPPAIITWIPGEGVWSVMDNLCHIREFVQFWTRETVRIVRRPDEQWGRDHTDSARLAAVTRPYSCFRSASGSGALRDGALPMDDAAPRQRLLVERQ